MAPRYAFIDVCIAHDLWDRLSHGQYCACESCLILLHFSEYNVDYIIFMGVFRALHSALRVVTSCTQQVMGC